MRVTYWTTACLEPDIEAVSKEVADLANHFADSRVFAVNPHLRLHVQRGARELGFHPSLSSLLRLIIPLLESGTDINHVYAEVSSWLFHKALRRKPTILTIASEKGDAIPEFLDRCRAIVVQTEQMRRKLRDWHVPDSKIELIYPGIDLSRFVPKLPRADRPRVKILLATFPRTAEELESRGVLLLIEAARQAPDVDFTFISRPWNSESTSLAAVQALLEKHHLKNVLVYEGVQQHMEDLYRAHDFTVVPFTTPDGGKECPRSLVESLACGVPVLISDVAPFSSFVDQHQCGEIFTLSASSLARAVGRALSRYDALSANANRCAHAFFDSRATLRAYAALYDRIRS